jgi:uncharacterized Zn ribbon protein
MKKFKKCEHCGALFIYERNTALYCSDACKQQAYIDRHSQKLASVIDARKLKLNPILNKQ